MKLTILAVNKHNEIIPPRTKKNHSRIVMPKGWKRPLLLPSEEYVEWEEAALLSFCVAGIIKKYMTTSSRTGKPKEAYKLAKGEPVNWPVNCRALVYRHMINGDSTGFYQAVGDFLQKAGFLLNDKLIAQWDGSRLLKDANRPRVELELTPVGEPALFAGGAE